MVGDVVRAPLTPGPSPARGEGSHTQKRLSRFVDRRLRSVRGNSVSFRALRRYPNKGRADSGSYSAHACGDGWVEILTAAGESGRRRSVVESGRMRHNEAVVAGRRHFSLS